MNLLLQILCIALTIYWVILIVRVILSFVESPPDPVRPLARGAHAVTEPLMAPLRSVIPPVQIGAVGLDLSILILFFAVAILRQVVCI